MAPQDALAPFDTASEWSRLESGCWRGTFTDDWSQGRTAFGGIIIAGALRALHTLAGKERGPRSVSATLLERFEPGAFDGEASLLREGRGISVAQMQVRQGEKVNASVLATFGAGRQSAVNIPAAMRPDRPSPDQTPLIPYIEGLMPRCQQHFETRYTDGGIPFSGTALSENGGWIRLRTGGTHPAAAAVAMLDAYPFPFMQTMNEPSPVASIMLTAHFMDLEGTGPDGWWWLRNKTVAAAAGFATFLTELYRPDGRLGAWGEQLVGVYDRTG